jgi:CubicO group peptidase (beta-lactamase class C family)
MNVANLKRREFLLASAGALAFAGGGCATGAVGDAEHFSWEVQPPEAAGIDPAALENVRAAVQLHIDNNVQTGAVTAFARNNKLVWFEAQGVRDVESGEPMRRDDIFRMMSSTKVITSVAVMMMADEGKLDINDLVSRYIPSFANPRVAIAPAGWERILDPSAKAELAAAIQIVPAEREITIKDLLTHTSGLSSSYGMLPGPGSVANEAAIQEATILEGVTLATRIPKVGEFVLDFQPGSRWGYSALDGMDTLLHIVEIVSGQEAEEFLQRRLFAPLEMHDTYFNVPADKQHRLLTLYERHENQWRQGTPFFGTAPTRYISGAGGLMSTAHDFLNFELMLLNRGAFNGRRILRPETVDLMTTNHVGTLFAEWIPAITNGLGFGLGGSVVLQPELLSNGRGRGSFGWGGAYGTDSWIDPENNVAAVYFVQQSGNFAGREYGRAIRDAVA